jgi:hypothetical protein
MKTNKWQNRNKKSGRVFKNSRDNGFCELVRARIGYHESI